MNLGVHWSKLSLSCRIWCTTSLDSALQPPCSSCTATSKSIALPPPHHSLRLARFRFKRFHWLMHCEILIPIPATWDFRVALCALNWISSFSWRMRLQVKDIWTWTWPIYSNFRSESAEHSGSACGAIFWTLTMTGCSRGWWHFSRNRLTKGTSQDMSATICPTCPGIQNMIQGSFSEFQNHREISQNRCTDFQEYVRNVTTRFLVFHWGASRMSGSLCSKWYNCHGFRFRSDYISIVSFPLKQASCCDLWRWHATYVKNMIIKGPSRF